jgi:signal transduction histidine kinase
LDRHFQRQGVLHKNFNELKRSVSELLIPELRDPVAAVSEYSQKLAKGLENVQTDEELVAHLQGIQVGSYRLSRSVQDFIFLVELRTGESVRSFRLRAKPENIGKLVEEATRGYQREVDLDGLEIDLVIGEKAPLSLPNGGPLVVIDREMFKVCMERMLDVMVKLAKANDASTIVINLFPAGRKHYLQFRLVGLMLPADVAEEISFTLDQQELPTLGQSQFDPELPVAKGVVHLHGGRIALENDPECAFSIILPAYRPISDSKRTVKEVV